VPRLSTLAAALTLTTTLAASSPAPAQSYPPGFFEELFAGGLSQPTTILPVKRGNFLVAEKSGTIWLVKQFRLQQIVLTLPVATLFERGICGLAIDPGFRKTGYLYVYYTRSSPTVANRLSRFYINGKNPLGPEEILIDGIASDSGLHNGGCLRFGPDGMLYVAVGDGGQVSGKAQDLRLPNGKILRIRRDGTIPPDNPFVGVPSVYQAIWAYGLRNPWRFAIDPSGSGLVLACDVGASAYEEVNRIERGANYGWPNVEGPGSVAGSREPFFAYPNLGGAAASCAAFYRGSEYPAPYTGSFFFGDFAEHVLRRLTIGPTGALSGIETFGTGVDSPVDMAQAADGNLYYVSFQRGAVYRIRYVGGENRPPTLRVTPSPAAGLAPLEVSFRMDGSFDPDGDPLAFFVDFGDGSSQFTTDYSVTHVFTEPRLHSVRVIAFDGRGGDALRVLGLDAGNYPPIPQIDSPVSLSLYAAGDEISFAGSGEDPEEGPLPASKLSWLIVFHHDTHTHPFMGPLAGIDSGSFVVPRTGEEATNVGFEISLSASDTSGQTRMRKVYVLPRTTTLELRTSPPGLEISTNGVPRLTPDDRPSVVGFEWALGVATPQVGSDGKTYDFIEWEDTGTAESPRTVLAPEAPATFRALFQERP